MFPKIRDEVNKPTLTRRGIGPYLRISCVLVSCVACAIHPFPQELETSPFVRTWSWVACATLVWNDSSFFARVQFFKHFYMQLSTVSLCFQIWMFELESFLYLLCSHLGGWRVTPRQTRFELFFCPPKGCAFIPTLFFSGICGEETCVSQGLMDVHHVNMCFDLPTKTINRFPHACSWKRIYEAVSASPCFYNI